MTQPVTLEDVAVQIGTVWEFEENPPNEEWWDHAAALIRAAQAVVEAAKEHDCDAHWQKNIKPFVCVMCNALAAFDAISKGEKP